MSSNRQDARIRLATAADAAAIAAIYAHYVSRTVITFEIDPPPDAAEFTQRLGKIGARYPWLVIEGDGRVLGYAYAGEHRVRAAYRWNVEVGIYLDTTTHRRGLGRRLYAALFELLRRQGYVNAYGVIALPNAASVGLHEALGFVHEALFPQSGFKAGAWHDVGWWSLRLQPPPLPPGEPVPLPAMDPAEIAAVLERA
jgi:L-amino acid N-acyltransferase YncA